MADEDSPPDRKPHLGAVYPTEKIAELIAENTRLRADIRGLRSVIEDAILWDATDSEGVPAVWLEAAQQIMMETAP